MYGPAVAASTVMHRWALLQVNHFLRSILPRNGTGQNIGFCMCARVIPAKDLSPWRQPDIASMAPGALMALGLSRIEKSAQTCPGLSTPNKPYLYDLQLRTTS
jgi:hypothetical protein